MSDDDKKANYWKLAAAADAAWKRDDMAEWERLKPLVEAAFAESGIEAHLALHPNLFNPEYRPEDN